MRSRSASGSASRDRHAVDPDAPALRVVEAQEECSTVTCRRPTGPTRATRSPGRDREAQPVEGALPGPGRIVEAHSLEGDLAARRLRQRQGLVRRRDGRLGGQDLAETLGRAGRLREFALDLRELAERACGEDRVEHELRERARRSSRPASTSCAPYQSTPTTLAETRKMAKPVRQRARSVVDRRAAANASSAAAAKRAAVRLLHAEGLHGAHGADRLGGEGGGIGEPVLRKARAPPHAPGRRRRSAGR